MREIARDANCQSKDDRWMITGRVVRQQARDKHVVNFTYWLCTILSSSRVFPATIGFALHGGTLVEHISNLRKLHYGEQGAG